MSNRKVMQQALDALLDLQSLDSQDVWLDRWSEAITSLREALEQQPEQQARVDVITVTLMREGINKHRARELADHFVNFTLTPPLPVQEPVGYVKGTYAGRLIYDTINPAVCLPVGMALYTAPLPVQESLAEEEIEAIGNQVANEKLVGRVPDFRVRFARAVEAKLKEKNHG